MHRRQRRTVHHRPRLLKRFLRYARGLLHIGSWIAEWHHNLVPERGVSMWRPGDTRWSALRYRPALEFLEGRITPIAPTITAITPNIGPIAGGQTVTITGTRFDGTEVDFGSGQGTILSYTSSTMQVKTPAESAATVNVKVWNALGQGSNTVPYTFTAAAPTVTGVSPTSAGNNGGTSVTITGTNLFQTSATKVAFGTTYASSFTVNSPTSITVTAPAHAVGTVDVIVTTSNGTSATSSADQVTYFVDQPPTIGTIANQTSNEGDGVSLQINATDPEGDPLTYSASPLPPGLSINSSTGLITGTCGNQSAGSYTVTVSVWDQWNAPVTKTFTWTVNDVTSPVFNTITPPSTNEGAAGTLTVHATDADSDTLTYGASGFPSDASWSINASTGVISFTPTNRDGQGHTSGWPVGVYRITVTATDGHSTAASQTFSWTVVDNTPPVAVNDTRTKVHDSDIIGEYEIIDIQPYVINTTLLKNDSDPDGDTITAVLASNPSHGTLISFGTDGSFDYRPNTHFYGTDTFTYYDTDGAVNSSIATVTLNITDNPPTLTAPANQTNNEGQSASLQLQGADADSDPLTYGASNLPTGLTINTATGLISGTISSAAAQNFGGVYNVTVWDTDNVAPPTTQNFTWTVHDITSPVVTNPGNQSSNEGQGISLQIHATDADNDPLTYTPSNLPAGLSINSSTGLISGTLANQSAGSYAVTVTVTDLVNSTNVSFTWTVADVTSPVVTNPGNRSNLEGDPINLQILTNDADGDPLTYSQSNLPAGLSLNTSTGLISGTISYSAAETSGGIYAVTITATDQHSTAGSASFTWTVTDYNPPPVVTNPGAQSSNEGQPVSLQIVATDANGDTLTYSPSNLPLGLSLNSATGLISGTPSNQSAGTYQTVISVSDGTSTTQAAFQWTVADITSPTVLNPGNQSNREGDPVSLAVSASDSDGDTLTYSASHLPTGLSINSSTGLISGSISYSAVEINGGGSFTVTVSASDHVSTAGSQTFTWTVAEYDPPPSITNPGDLSNSEGQPVSLQIQASVPDGDTLTYSAAHLPTGLSIDTSTGLVSGTLTNQSAGTYATTVSVSDGTNTTTAAFNWTVTDVTSPVMTNPGSQSNLEGDPVNLQIVTTDADGDPLTYSATPLPAGLSLNTSTGLISGTISYTAAETNGGNYTVTITATDNHSAPASQTFTWTVIYYNAPPVVTNPGDQSSNEGDPVSLHILASDPNGDTLTYAETNLPAGLSIDTNTGIISGTLSNQSAGSHAVSVTVSDGVNSTPVSLNWTVTDVTAPVLSNPGNQINNELDTSNLQLHATDSDGDPLTYSEQGLPVGLSLDSSTGLISGMIDWQAAQNNNNGIYAVTVTADDGHNTPSTQTFTWTVIDVTPPQLDSPPGNQTSAEGDQIQLAIQGSDDDFDPLSYSASHLPDGLTIVPQTGWIWGTIGYGAAEHQGGVYNVTVNITDGYNTVAVAFTWTVSDTYAPPTLTNPGNQVANEGDPVSLQLSADDPNADPLTYSSTPLPAGLSLDPATGIISGTVGLAAAQTNGGIYTVTVSVNDGIGAPVSQTFTWTVTDVTAPVITNPANQQSNEGDPVSLPINVTDSDGDPLTYSATHLPQGLSIDPNTGLISGTLTSLSGGTYATDVSVTDGSHVSSLVFAWTVVDGTAPTLSNPGAQSSAEGQMLTLVFQSGDADGDALTYSATGLPVGLAIDPNTGVISGMVSYAAAEDSNGGIYAVTISAFDGTNTSSQAFTWTITDVNTSPAITTPGDQANNEGDNVAFQIVASDIDGDALTYNATTTLPAGLSINPITGLIFGTLANQSAGTYHTIITVSDGVNAVSTSFNWTVTDGSAPAFVALDDQANGEGASIALQIRATDADGDPLTFDATGLPGGLSINRTTGVISGQISYTAAADMPGGIYAVALTVTDGQNTANAIFHWTIGAHYDSSPIITNPGNQANNEGDLVSLPINASDPDGDTLTYSASDLPAGLSIDANTGLISGTLSGQSAGVYTTTVTVTDGFTPMATSFTWTVTDITAPGFVNPGPQTNAEGNPIALATGGSDADGDGLTFSATGLPAGLAINPATGVIYGQIGYSAAETNGGVYNVTVTCADPFHSSSEGFTWTVSDVDTAPVLTNPGNKANRQGDGSLLVQLVASEPDGDTLYFTATNLPGGLSIDSATGAISGAIASGAATGSYAVTATVTDGTSSSTVAFSWVIASSTTTGTDTWTNPAGGSWNNPGNWSLGYVPTVTNDVVMNLNSGAEVDLSSGTATVNSLNVHGTLVINGGSLNVERAFNVTGRLSMQSGNLAGGWNVTVQNNSTFDLEGGTVGCAVIILNSAVTLGPGGTAPATFWINGSSTLTGNISAGQTVMINGDNFGGSAVLTAQGDFTNAGTIIMKSSDVTNAYTSNLADQGGRMTNTGLISIQQGAGGARGMPADFTNYGTIKVDAGTGSTVACDNWVLAGGQVAVDPAGWFILSGGHVIMTGGTIPTGQFFAYNAEVAVAASVATAATIACLGNCTLDYNASPLVTLWVRGCNFGQSAVLTTLPGAYNAGTIHMESVESNQWASNLAINGAFTNSGTISVSWGAVGGGRSITGHLINEGLLQTDMTLGFTGIYEEAGGGVTGTGAVVLTNTEIRESRSPGIASTLYLQGYFNTLTTDNVANMTLWVQGTNYGGNAVLSVTGQSTNTGTILLESAYANSYSALSITGVLDNGPLGTISVVNGGGGNRTITGHLVNQGRLTVDGNTNVTFTGMYEEAGGSVIGAVYLLNSHIRESLAAANPSTLIIHGYNNVLDSDNLANMTLWIQGSTAGNNAVLTTAPGITNWGTIRLEVIDWLNWSSGLSPLGGTLVNAPGGTILVNPGQEARSYWIAGTVENRGTISVTGGTELDLNALGTQVPHFILAGGQVEITGRLLLNGGRFDFTGGSISGGFYAVNSEINVTSTATTASTLQLVGAYSVLDNNLSPAVTLWVEGSNQWFDGILTTLDGAVNAGTIVLETLDWSNWKSSIVTSTSLTNGPTGAIEVLNGAGGPRSISGRLINEGHINVAADSQLTIQANGQEPAYLGQLGGSIQANGAMVLNGGGLDFAGGAISGLFYVYNADILVEPGVNTASTVRVIGPQNTLEANQSSYVTLWVQGSNMGEDGSLTTAPGAINAGTIILESVDWSYWNSGLVASNNQSFVNSAGGQIDVIGGVGGARTITGNLINYGSLVVSSDTQLNMNGAPELTPTLMQMGGTIQADGRFVLNGGNFDYEGGMITGLFYSHNAEIHVGPGVADAATIRVIGTQSTLDENASPSVTLLVEGDNLGENALLTTTPGALNAGTIQLQTADWSYWNSRLAITDTLLNTPTGIITVGSGAGGARTISGTLINFGTVYVAPDVKLNYIGAGTQPPILMQVGGAILVDGQLVFEQGGFDYEGGAVAGNFYVHNSVIYVAPAVIYPSVIRVIGEQNTLDDNASTAVTLWVQGGFQAGNAVLTIAPNAVNAGTIQLESIDSNFTCGIAAGDWDQAFTNLQSGSILINQGMGGDRFITGTIINRGFIGLSGSLQVSLGSDFSGQDIAGALINDGVFGANAYAGDPTAANGVIHLTGGQLVNNSFMGVDPGTDLLRDSVSQFPSTTVQNGGNIFADGNFIVQGGPVTITGGRIGGAFGVENTTLDVAPTVTASSQIAVLGSGNSLIRQGAPAVTLRVRGGPLGGSALLITKDGSYNKGTIVLEETDSRYRAQMALSGKFTNYGKILIIANQPNDALNSILASGVIEPGNLEDSTGLAPQPFVNPWTWEPVEDSVWDIVEDTAERLEALYGLPLIKDGVLNITDPSPIGLVGYLINAGGQIIGTVANYLIEGYRAYSQAVWDNLPRELSTVQVAGGVFQVYEGAGLVLAATAGGPFTGALALVAGVYLLAHGTSDISSGVFGMINNENVPNEFASLYGTWAGDPYAGAIIDAGSLLLAGGVGQFASDLIELSSSQAALGGAEGVAQGEAAGSQALADAATAVESTPPGGAAIEEGMESATNALAEAEAARATQAGEELAAAENATNALEEAAAEGSQRVSQELVQQQIGTQGCFAAGTPLLTPMGHKLIEQFRVGDLILSALETNPDSPPEAKVVEEVFTDHARLWDLRVGGKVIRATAKHPFFVRGKGWTELNLLQEGDQLRSHDGRWMAVQSVRDSGADAIVHNLRIAQYHTYFVGDIDWGFSIWAHNACISWITPGSLPAAEEQAVLDTLEMIEGLAPPPAPGSLQAVQWGTTFGNREGFLPTWAGQAADYYHEYTVLLPGQSQRGLLRIVTGDNGEMYYTWTHYGTTGGVPFVRIR
jgi:guanyl-specific ribonuclease Sa